MRVSLFIIALIFIGETLFRLLPYNPQANYDLFLLSDQQVNLTNYLYYFFEHLKVIGLVSILCIENTRWKWLRHLVIIDLVVYILNYSSTLTYIDGFPVGMDALKLIIFGIVITREAINGRDTNLNQHRDIVAYAHGNVSETLRSKARSFFTHKAKQKDQ